MSNQVQEVKQKSNHALITEAVLSKVKNLESAGSLSFPENYNVYNAIQAAYLVIKETQDSSKRPALEVCTQDSIIQAVMNMAVQGLNPTKNQCYFIVYGNKLTMQRSYFGSVSVAKQLNPNIEDIFAEVVYQDDVFKMGRKRGKTFIEEHVTALENIDKKKIKAAYATVIFNDGREESVIMTKDQIYQAWKQSKMNVFDEKGNLKPNTVHGKFTEEMAKKTVLNRLCKPLINTTDDSALSKAIIESDEDHAIESAKETITIEAENTKLLDVEVAEEKEDNIVKVNETVVVNTSTGEIIDDYDDTEINDFPEDFFN